MESLRRIVGCFKPSECQYIRNYYLQKKKGSATKSLQLFDIVRNDLAESNIQACKLIYNKEKESSFRQLKARLKKDLLNFTLLFPSLENTDDPAMQAELECRKALAQAKVLSVNDERCESISLMQHALRLARRYDIPEIKIDAANQLRSLFENDPELYKDYSSELKKNLEVQSGVVLTETCKRLLTVSKHAHVDVKDDLDKIEFLYKKTGSPNLGRRFYSLKMRFHEMNRNYSLSYLNGLRAAHLVTSNVAVDCTRNRLEVRNQLAQVLLSLKSYSRAKRQLTFARNLTKQANAPCLQTLENSFRLSFAIRDYKESNACVSEVLDYLKPSDEGWSKWQYYSSCIDFANRQFRTSIKRLSEVEFSKEKFNLSLEYRILELLNLFELKEFDLLGYKIESLRKFIAYHKAQYVDQTFQVLRFFQGLLKYGGDLNRLKKDDPQLVDGLPGLQDSIIDISEWAKEKIHSHALA